MISFYPGVSCEEAGCGRVASECKIDDRTYEVGEKAVLGCQECTCESSGQFVCRYYFIRTLNIGMKVSEQTV